MNHVVNVGDNCPNMRGNSLIEEIFFRKIYLVLVLGELE